MTREPIVATLGDMQPLHIIQARGASPDLGTFSPMPRPIVEPDRHADVTATVTAAAALAPFDRGYDVPVVETRPEASVALHSPSQPTTSASPSMSLGSQLRLRLTVMLAALAVVLEVVTVVALAVDVRLAGAAVAAFVACLVGMRVARLDD